MPVLESVIADCSSPEEANTQVLETVLNHLRTNVTELDKAYAREKITSLESSLQSLQSDLEAAQSILPQISQNTIIKKYFRKFAEFWNVITNELEKLMGELIENRDTPDENLRNQIEQVLNECRNDENFPSLDEIEELRRNKGAYRDTYTAYIQDFRTRLSLRFLKMDEGLKKTIEAAKERVANVLIHQCELGGLTDKRGAEFIEDIAQKIPEEYFELKTSFKILGEFTLSYRGLIQHRIRRQLDELNPDKAPEITPGNEAQQIADNLECLYGEAVYKCEQSLKDFFVEPNQASFAIVEEFCDRILRAKNAKDQWREFLLDNKEKIWSSEFGKLQEQVESVQIWGNKLNNISTKIKDLKKTCKDL
jgi:hypothetical protein